MSKKSSNWTSDASGLVRVGLILGIGFGLMGYILYTFMTALGVNSPGGNFVNAILTAFSSSITTILPAVITIAFVMLLYIMVKKSGLMGGGSES